MKIWRKISLAALLLIAGIWVIILIPERRERISSSHFNLSFTASIAHPAMESLLSTLENNYRRVGDDLGTEPAGTIDVSVYASRWRYVKATGNWGGSGNIEGINKLHLLANESQNSEVVIHEFSHAVVLKLLLDREQEPLDVASFDKKFENFPTWLWEAVSVYEANQFVDPRTLPYLQDGKYPSLKELNQRLKGGKIYDCGYTIVEYILSVYGRESLIKLIAAYGDVRKILQISDDQFSSQWYAFIRQKYL